MKRRLILTVCLSVLWLVAASSSVLASAIVSGPDNTIKTRTKGKAAGLEVGFIPQESWLEPKEGNIGSSSMMIKVDPTTFVVPAWPVGGEETDPACSAGSPTCVDQFGPVTCTDPDGIPSCSRGTLTCDFNTPECSLTAGLVRCSGAGANTYTCKFIKLGPLSDERAPLLVNPTTVVVQGLGPDGVDCEAGKNGEPADDVLFLAKTTGKVRTITDLCLFAHATDPIRVNDDTIVFVQPGDNNELANSGNCGDDPGHMLVVVTGLKGGGRKVTKLNVGALLGVHLGGSAAGRPIRVSDSLVAIASPGANGHFASSFGPACDSSPEPADDGLVILKLGVHPSLSFLPTGTIPGNMNGRPVRVNDTAVALIDTGGVGSDMEQQGDNFGNPADELNDDRIIIVDGLGSPPVATAYGPFGFLRRPLRLNMQAIVAFEEEGDGHASRSDVPIRAHFIRGIPGSVPLDEVEGPECFKVVGQEIKSLDVTMSGDFHAFSEDLDHTKKDNTGLVLNCNQVAVWTDGSPADRQAFLLTNMAMPIVTPSTEADGDLWHEVKAARINKDTVLYVADVGKAKVIRKGLGVLKALADGSSFTDTRYILPTGALSAAGCSPWGGSANQPVRVSDKRGVVLAEGKDCDLGEIGSTLKDDGLIVIDDLETSVQALSFVKTGRSCAAPGCTPLALGGSSPDLVALAAPGKNADIGEDISASSPRCSSGTPSCGAGEEILCQGSTPKCSSATPTCTDDAGDMGCSGTTVTCTSGLPTCTSGSPFCLNSKTPICDEGSSSCGSGSPFCLNNTPICDEGGLSCSASVFSCSTGKVKCTEGFTAMCAGSSDSCEAKDDDEFIIVEIKP